jgi:hypothetical protein
MMLKNLRGINLCGHETAEQSVPQKRGRKFTKYGINAPRTYWVNIV